MLDHNGAPLQKGDHVLIPAVITNLGNGREFDNCCVRTEFGRWPDGQADTLFKLNSGQLVKFRGPDPEPPATDNVYFDPKTGMRPEDLGIEAMPDAITLDGFEGGLLVSPDGNHFEPVTPLITELSTELATA